LKTQIGCKLIEKIKEQLEKEEYIYKIMCRVSQEKRV
jgi:hypothetical protein